MSQITMVLPPPRLWQEFEELTKDAARFFFNDPAAKNYGNQGAPQNGVDVYCNENQTGRLIGIQCKRLGKTDTNGKALPGGLKPTHLETELKKARKFDPNLKHFIIATTDSRQTSIQDAERWLNEQQIRAGAFTFQVWFWEDFLGFLHKYSDLLQWYYDRILQMKGVYNLDHQILYLLSIALSRPAFSTRLDAEERGEHLFEALRDTETAFNTGQLRDRGTKGLIRAAPGGATMIGNSAWRSDVQRSLEQVQEARRKYKLAKDAGDIVELPHGVIVRDHLVGHEINQLRGTAIRILNGILKQAGLPEVVTSL